MLLYKELTNVILKAFYDVYNTLGYGFLENVYQNAMYKELQRRGLKCEPQKKIEVYYKGEVVGTYFADILVEDVVILELKAASELSPAHAKQLMNYLKATGIEVGLLLNFGEESPVFERKVYTMTNPAIKKKVRNFLDIINNEDEDHDSNDE